ncbi:MAG: serine hydrolase domain-containing protein [Bacteroidota bacterium]
MKILIVTTILFAITSLHGQNLPVKLSKEDEAHLDSICQLQLQENKFPGLAIGIVANGETLYAKGFGVKKLGGTDSVTTTSVFHLASISKTFVATSIGLLIEQQKLTLEDKVTDHLPYFEMKDSRYKDITIRHLLTHTSGMPDVSNYHWKKAQFHDKALEDYVKSIKTKKLKSDPGVRHDYSNMAFEILGDVIAKVSGTSFEVFVKKSILEPAGMNNSSFYLPDIDTSLLTTPHVKRPFVKVHDSYPYNRLYAPSSTLNSNVEDMLNYMKLYANKGTLNGQEVFSESTYNLLTQEHFKIDGARSRGLALELFSYKDLGFGYIGFGFSHAGSDIGFQSLLVNHLDRSFAFVIMHNGYWNEDYSKFNKAAIRLKNKYAKEHLTKSENPHNKH